MNQYSTSNYHFCTLNDTNFLKPLPTLTIVQKLIDICQAPMTLFESQQRNKYDRKNHILYINNYNLYATTLKEKYGRTVESFQKQLKMMGFRKRKLRQHSNEQYLQFQSQPSKLFTKYNSSINLQQYQQKANPQNSVLFQVQQVKNRKLSMGHVIKDKKQQKFEIGNEQKQIKYMLVWRTNRIRLIEKQMEDLQSVLEQEIQKAMRMKEQIQKRRKQLDKQMETMLLAGLVNEVTCFTEIDTNLEIESTGNKIKQTIKPIPSLQSHLSKTLQKLKKVSNLSQQQAAEFIRKISKCSQSQLQLYKALIYKQTHLHRSADEE